MTFAVKPVTPVIGVLLMCSALASAQGPRAHMGMRMYDAATETTLKGTVDSVNQQERGPGWGTHLTLKTGETMHNIMLGPSSFLASKKFTVSKGNSIEVTGSRVTINGTEYIIAREVIKQAETLTLRDKTGIPAWAGMGRRAK